ncbi:zf-HC2 domain-containing protein [Spirillospora sp. NPDC047279]|uniref:zf-HC2 domain-containing protein n=1 Tax=Spirillospora sp. NPDC047279 TaxID=3155478 RepID=UPI0034114F07
MGGNCGYQIDLGVYALGQLTGPEAADLRAHLSRCELCRTELSELQGVVRVLTRTRRSAGRGSRTGASVRRLSGACAASRGPWRSA